MARRSSAAPEAADPDPGPLPLKWAWLAAVLIAVAVIGVYLNTLQNEFVTFDDRKYIYENELVTGDGGLAAIWGDIRNEKPKLHYRPVTFTVLWLEHALVGLEPADAARSEVVNRAAHPLYHWTQILFHAANAILLLFALRALRVPDVACLLVAALFAVHPVNVASVAWMAEIKNVISGTFFWLALLLYIRHRRSAAFGYGLYYAAVAAFALALLAKVAAVVLVPILIVTDRLLDRRWSWNSVARSIPFFALGLWAARITAVREASIAKAWEPIAFQYRPFIAVSALVHYVVKTFVPVRQAIIYPRWALSFANPRFWVSLVVVAVAAFLIWRYRERLADPWLWGLGLFLLSVAPVLGLKYFIWMQFAFVSDHYMYYGGPGVLLLLALPLAQWCRGGPEQRLRRGRLAAVAIFGILALVGCSVRTVQQNRTWKNNFTLWDHTLRISPECVICNLNMGNHYARLKQHEQALAHYREFARIRPDYVRAWRSCAWQARELGRQEEAKAYYRRGIQVADIKPPGSVALRLEFANYLLRIGSTDEALQEFEAALAKRPPNSAAIEAIMRRIRDGRPDAGSAEP